MLAFKTNRKYPENLSIRQTAYHNLREFAARSVSDFMFDF